MWYPNLQGTALINRFAIKYCIIALFYTYSTLKLMFALSSFFLFLIKRYFS